MVVRSDEEEEEKEILKEPAEEPRDTRLPPPEDLQPAAAIAQLQDFLSPPIIHQRIEKVQTYEKTADKKEAKLTE